MRRAVAAIAVVLCAIPAMAAERWWDHYRKGTAAINAKSYEAAADSLRRAIAEAPNESTSARTRKEIIVYVPHFFLGIAKFHLGDFDGALAEWKLSEEQGAIQNTDYYSSLKEWVNRARAEKQKSARDAASDSRKAADAAISRALSGQTEAVAAGGDRSDNYRAAERKLREALEQYGKAGTDVRAYQRAGETAQQARELFIAAADEAKKARVTRAAAARQQAPVQQKPAATEPPKQVAQQAPQPVTVTQTQPAAQTPPVEVVVVEPKPAPAKEEAPVETEALVDARVALQTYRGKLLSAANDYRRDGEYQNEVRRAQREANRLDQQLRSKPDRETIQEVLDRVAALEAELTAAARKAAAASSSDPRSQLVHAYRAFASGDFTSAEAILTRLLESKQLGEAYLLRGCSRYTRAMLSRNPSPLLDQAANDFKSALRLNHRLRLDGKAFSPKIVEFFEQVRKSS